MSRLTMMVVIFLLLRYLLVVVEEVAPCLRPFEVVGSVFHSGLARLVPG